MYWSMVSMLLSDFNMDVFANFDDTERVIFSLPKIISQNMRERLIIWNKDGFAVVISAEMRQVYKG